MFVASLRFELHIADSHSLKQKRAVLKPVLEGARRRFSVAVAEVDHQEKWQRSTIGIAVIASSHSHACEILDRVERFVWSFPELQVLATDRAWLEDA